ncbi:DNA topoisomerase IV subunit A [Salsuginibacillus halophilus]|uniref:DNA topoisomerase 4 subunit A n=1 Tax=Salsuginibacillus halophilus TaxID=517424 RepID=A0A2P8HWP4_9BACI|nr:DNA topoisomerase IV subunit A [Salsuginibacillus halophilus]PSL50629.1 DNA topoisomerase IV subunit A [Salsuginibacillus halophilus]
MAEAETYLDLPLEDVLGDRFGRYSKYIIQERALPDARDGLKPVQRRILYAMLQDGNTAEKPFRKAAKTVGNVIGNYHPHGDSSVYEALVRMSQDWKARHLLVQMHGNNGSIDGDPPAAMRYTEARLAPIAKELLRDIEKETVEFIPNFDDTEEEPVVLPAKFPNLLVNGSTGISSGYATDIPPHNLSEVIDAVLMRMDQPASSVSELMEVMPGPDFPGGGILQGKDGIKKAYETGKGKAILRGLAEVEELRGGREQIVITELPYDVVKANLVKKMDEIRFDKKVDGIAEVRDDTDRTGMRVVIELKKDADATSILHYLYKNTELQMTYNFNMVAISDRTPALLSLPELLDAYIQHQKDVIENRSTYELRKAKDRLHIVEGLVYAVSILDEVIQTIRSSENKKDAKANLIEAYQFTDAQAEAIVNLQLYRLTNTDVTTLEEEKAELEKRIAQLEAILQSEKKLALEVKKELRQVRKTYHNERRTVIEETVEELKIDKEAMIPAEDVYVTVTKEGYIKRTSPRSYQASNDERPGMKETDDLIYFSHANTTETLLLFTENGHYIYIPIYELPDIRWKDNGQHVANIVPIDQNDRLIAAEQITQFSNEWLLTFFTAQGMVKQTPLSEYQPQRYSKPLVAVKLKGEDRVVSVSLTNGNHQLFMATKNGNGLRLHEEQVSVTGQRTAGVKGMNVKDDEVVAALAVPAPSEDEAVVAVVTHRGAAKKMKLTEFPLSNRATKGQSMFRELKKDPHRLVYAGSVPASEQIAGTTKEGDSWMKRSVQHLKLSERYSNGSYIIDTKETGTIASVWTYVDHAPDSST